MKAQLRNRIFLIIICILITKVNGVLNAQIPQMGGNFRPSYESYRLDKFIEQGDATYSGDMGLSIPLLTVLGRHGHNFEIKINYNSNVQQQQFASWVGLGWTLEPGCVERTVNGRTDEPSHLNGWLGYQQEGLLRGNLGGRFGNDTAISRDVADTYRLSIDGGGMQIIPFPSQKDSTLTLDTFNFLPVQYKPWAIGAFNSGTTDGSFSLFQLYKEDGTCYYYGSNSSAGSVEVLKVMTDPNLIDAGHQQSYQFPYRWNLSNIRYPDGSATTITYSFHNSYTNMCLRRYGSVMIDRSQTANSGVGNFFGNIPYYGGNQYDYALYSYSHPDMLSTDTHYLVFRVSVPTADSTERLCRLDTLILYERSSNKELKRVVFHYAASPNSAPAWTSPSSNSIPAWNPGQRLNNNQLTLIGITVKNNTSDDDGGNSADVQQYYFTYTNNPKIDIESAATLGYSSHSEEWPGYFTNAALNTAWRLQSVTLPTGGKYTYNYESENVLYDPEGHVWSDSIFSGGAGGNYWNYNAQPHCRLCRKIFDDGMGTQRTWTYSYDDNVVYDPPSGVYQGTYIPFMYRSLYKYKRDEFYIVFRGCGIGHRWVQVNNPDYTYHRFYYTSSYKQSDADPSEKQPDNILNIFPTTQYNTITSSRSGCRGLVWKEESGQQNSAATTTTRYYYSYVQ